MPKLKLLEVMPDIVAGYGLGKMEHHRLCVMAMCAVEDRLRHGESIGELTDQCECVSPVLRTLAIEVNDCRWYNERSRTKWALETVPKLLDTNDEKHDWRRLKAVIKHLVHEIVVPHLMVFKYPEFADELSKSPTLEVCVSIRRQFVELSFRSMYDSKKHEEVMHWMHIFQAMESLHSHLHYRKYVIDTVVSVVTNLATMLSTQPNDSVRVHKAGKVEALFNVALTTP